VWTCLCCASGRRFLILGFSSPRCRKLVGSGGRPARATPPMDAAVAPSPMDAEDSIGPLLTVYGRCGKGHRRHGGVPRTGVLGEANNHPLSCCHKNTLWQRALLQNTVVEHPHEGHALSPLHPSMSVHHLRLTRARLCMAIAMVAGSSRYLSRTPHHTDTQPRSFCGHFLLWVSPFEASPTLPFPSHPRIAFSGAWRARDPCPNCVLKRQMRCMDICTEPRCRARASLVATAVLTGKRLFSTEPRMRVHNLSVDWRVSRSIVRAHAFRNLLYPRHPLPPFPASTIMRVSPTTRCSSLDVPTQPRQEGSGASVHLTR
jgi:hypothetical protein